MIKRHRRLRSARWVELSRMLTRTIPAVLWACCGLSHYLNLRWVWNGLAQNDQQSVVCRANLIRPQLESYWAQALTLPLLSYPSNLEQRSDNWWRGIWNQIFISVLEILKHLSYLGGRMSVARSSIQSSDICGMRSGGSKFLRRRVIAGRWSTAIQSFCTAA